MAAAKAAKKKATAKTASGAPADTTPGLEEIRIKYDPVMVELSRAEAARCLLVKNQDGLFDDDETAEWVESFATDILSEALAAAKAAYVKVAVDRAATTAPAAEPAR
jgi:hypothetical protein